MKFEETIVNLILDAGKGNCAVSSREGVVGKPFGKLPQPVRSGYKFEGWYLGDTLVTEETVLTAEDDIRLEAHWSRNREKKQANLMTRQRIFAFALAVAIVFLSVALAIASGLVKIYTLTDTFVDASGEKQTVKYQIKINKETGQYALYNKAGELMAIAPDNGYNNYTDTDDGTVYVVYEADVSGNQYRINTSTGEYELYAVVDTENGEVLGGTVVVTRVMIFPYIEQEDVYSIEVNNQYGNYRVYRKTVDNTAEGATTAKTSVVTMESNGEELAASYDATMFANLCVCCGYTLSLKKLDLTSADAPRKADGSIDYSVYGLETYTDGSGKIDYTKSPATYTIIKGRTGIDGSAEPTSTKYTVEVGDPVVSYGGYYVRLPGREAVYVLTSSLAQTVLQPVESLVEQKIVYELSSTTYSMVEDFSLRKVTVTGNDTAEDLIVACTFADMDSRENTLYSSFSYLPGNSGFMTGYHVNSTALTNVMSDLLDMEYLAVMKAAPKPADLATYGLDTHFWMLAYGYDPYVAQGGSDCYIPNIILISEKTYSDLFGQDVYYIYSYLYDLIVAVDPYYASFVEWDRNAWYNSMFMQMNVAYVRDMKIETESKSYHYVLDNSESDLSSAVGSGNLKVYRDSLSMENLIDYTITKVTKTDTGVNKVTEHSATENYKRMYQEMLRYSIEGDVNADEFKNSTGMTVSDFIASDVNDDKADVKITLHIEDYAATMNTVTDSDGNKLYPENNSYDVCFRFYSYGNSGRKLLLTIERIDKDDTAKRTQAGDPIFDATDGEGSFYVLSTQLEYILDCVENFENQVLIP